MTDTPVSLIEKLKEIMNYAGSCAEGPTDPEFTQFIAIEADLKAIISHLESKAAQLPKEPENGITHYVQVGKFLLAHGRSHPAKVWIEIANDGEGGEFNQSDLELVLKEFYEKHF